MGKKFWLSVVCMFVLSMLLDFAVHSVLLGADYAYHRWLQDTPIGPQSVFKQNVNLNVPATVPGSPVPIIFGRVLNGNYAVSFFIAVALYMLASALYYRFFRGVEDGQPVVPYPQQTAQIEPVTS